MIDFEKIEMDYQIDGTEDDKLFALKTALFNLPPSEKNIFMLYLEFGTYTAVAKVLHCSSPTAKKAIMKIKEKLRNDIH